MTALEECIREAEIADLPRLLPLAREFYAQSKFLRGFDDDRFLGMWVELLERNAGKIFLLGNEAEEVIGALGGVLYAEPYSGESIATEFFWYVREGARGRGMKLYWAFERWARAQGCGQIRMVHLLDSMPEKLARAYKHLGYVPCEVHYVKEL